MQTLSNSSEKLCNVSKVERYVLAKQRVKPSDGIALHKAMQALCKRIDNAVDIVNLNIDTLTVNTARVLAKGRTFSTAYAIRYFNKHI